ncbi:MAG: hypothetical protein A2X31_04265 [Elusimicrobia bacterium GWB2_63_22]|nr:MAG: hypothetical protein A2X31_04265 [Elusimicrobia bacterium GWB2_63_22]
MTYRKGFTMAELILAIFIFGFMSMSLATIYATANRHMFQNYRRNIIKTNADFAMKVLHNTLSTATRIDRPAYGAADNILAFASNVSQGLQAANSPGCYRISPPDPAAWHYFCVAPDNTPGNAGLNNLYYHTGLIPGGAAGCMAAAPATWNGTGASGYPAFCGFGGGGTVTLLMQYVVPPLPPRSQFTFSRAAVDGVREVPSVRISLRSFWVAANRGFAANQRDVDFSLDSLITINRASLP